MKQKSFLFSSRGMSLIEVMIVITIMSLIGLGTATLMKNMFSIQRRAGIKQVVGAYQQELESLLKNDQSWTFTVNDTTNTSKLGCLRDSSATLCNSVAPPNWSATDFRVEDTSGALFFNGNSGTAGFDYDGNACNAFSVTSGHATCAFRYQLRWRAECPPGVNPCRKPQVVIQGTLLYAPLDASAINNRVNTADYSFLIRRGERIRNEPFEIIFEDLDGDANGGGACNPGGRRIRPLTRVTYDAGGNVSHTPNSPNFTLLPGTYSCKVIAQSFEANLGFSILLEDVTNSRDYPAGSGYSGTGTTSYAVGTVELSLTGNTTFRLIHVCQASHPDNATWDMGIPVPTAAGTYSTTPGQGTTYTNISCVRTS